MIIKKRKEWLFLKAKTKKQEQDRDVCGRCEIRRELCHELREYREQVEKRNYKCGHNFYFINIKHYVKRF